MNTSIFAPKKFLIDITHQNSILLSYLPDILRRMTLKQRKTAAWTAGDTGTVRRHSDSRSVMSGIWRSGGYLI